MKIIFHFDTGRRIMEGAFMIHAYSQRRRLVTGVLLFAVSSMGLCQAPKDLIAMSPLRDLPVPGVELTVGYRDKEELEAAVPGDLLNIEIYLVSANPIPFKLTRVEDEDGSRYAIFSGQIFETATNKKSADGSYYTTAAKVRVSISKDADPRMQPLKLVFGSSQRTATIPVPIGMRPPTDAKDANYIVLNPPKEVSVNAFGKPDDLLFKVENKFPEYMISILKYTVESKQGLIVKQELTGTLDQPILKIRHGRTGTLRVPVSADAWNALITADPQPQLSVSVFYSDGYRNQTAIFPDITELPFRMNFAPMLTLLVCLIGSLMGALFRSQAPLLSPTIAAERKWKKTRRMAVWSVRAGLALLAGFLLWTLSNGFDVALVAKSVAILSVKTPYGALLIGFIAGVIPPSRFGAWIYERVTGSPVPVAQAGDAA
jgi:hypothetical protein